MDRADMHIRVCRVHGALSDAGVVVGERLLWARVWGTEMTTIDEIRARMGNKSIESFTQREMRLLFDTIERLETFVAEMRTIPILAEGHNSAHNWASMRVEAALKVLDDASGQQGAG